MVESINCKNSITLPRINKNQEKLEKYVTSNFISSFHIFTFIVRFCDRSSNDVDTSTKFLMETRKTQPCCKCRPTLVNGNMTRLGRVCFGRGHCDCGECVCDSPRPGVIITGKFCQTVKKKNVLILQIRQIMSSASHRFVRVEF